MTLQERIKGIRTKFHIDSQADLAKIMGVNAARVKSLEVGRVKKISLEEANILVKKFNLSLDWILYGEGNILNTNTIRNNLIEVPYLEETYATAGDGAINYQDYPTIMAFDINFLKSQLGITSFKGLHIINSIGDSMFPTISPSELLFILPFENDDNILQDGCIYVISAPQGVLVKRIGIHPTEKTYTLISDNPKREDVILQGDEIDACKIIGRVVGHFQST